MALEARHPEQSGDEWLEVVSSSAIDDPQRLLLFDPLALPSEIEELAAGRDTAIVLTWPWQHSRLARAEIGELSPAGPRLRSNAARPPI